MINDEKVTAVSAEEALQQYAYILFYQRVASPSNTNTATEVPPSKMILGEDRTLQWSHTYTSNSDTKSGVSGDFGHPSSKKSRPIRIYRTPSTVHSLPRRPLTDSTPRIQSKSLAHTHIHTHTHSLTHTNSHKHTQTHTLTQTHPHTLTHTLTLTHIHIPIHTYYLLIDKPIYSKIYVSYISLWVYTYIRMLEKLLPLPLSKCVFNYLCTVRKQSRKNSNPWLWLPAFPTTTTGTAGQLPGKISRSRKKTRAYIHFTKLSSTTHHQKYPFSRSESTQQRPVTLTQ
jgi:hypothetical protein